MVTRAALKLMVILFVRTRELIEAKWEELDLENAIWRIPAERMKLRVEHLVPLPKQALALFDELKQFRGESEYVFPGDRNPNQPMSNNTLLYGGIYRMGYRSRATIHGFRSLASSISMNRENGTLMRLKGNWHIQKRIRSGLPITGLIIWKRGSR